MFRAYDASRDRAVAIKLFTLDLSSERMHQLVGEFERLIDAALDHPALAAPIATGTAGTSAYLVQEFFDAQSLDLAVREYGPAPAADALRVAAQLAGALDFAAAVNITHGALHSRDVLLSPNETRLTGIGVAPAFERIGIAPPVRRPFTPPEQIAGAPWDRRADVFGLAALMHELLSGRRVTGTGAHAVESLPDVHGADLAALRSVFARGLAEDPAARYATALELAEALNGAFPEAASQARVAAPAPAENRQPFIVSAAAPPQPRPDERPPAAPPRLPLGDEAPVPSAAIAPHVPAAAAPSAAVDARLPANATSPDPSTLVLNAAEQERYRDVEVAPSIVEPELAPVNDGLAAAPPRAHNRRLVLWPIAAALAIGIGAGFLGGYGVGSRDRLEVPVYEVSPPIASAQRAAATSPATPPAGREFTESAVSEAPKPSPPPAPPTPSSASADTAAGNRPTGTPTATSNSGRVLVRSTPAGARVFVDGREYGPTPAAVRDLAVGTHQVRITRDGYVTEERRVVITAARPAQSITVPLDRARSASAAVGDTTPAPSTPATVGRFVGRLVVDSRPSGAKVFVDGKLVGNTPLALGDVRAGEHVVRIEQDGYRRWSSSVRVVAAEQNKVTASLER